MIGRVGGKQQISLGYGCEQKGVVIHEMLHALGMFFLKQFFKCHIVKRVQIRSLSNPYFSVFGMYIQSKFPYLVCIQSKFNALFTHFLRIVRKLESEIIRCGARLQIENLIWSSNCLFHQWSITSLKRICDDVFRNSLVTLLTLIDLQYSASNYLK